MSKRGLRGQITCLRGLIESRYQSRIINEVLRSSSKHPLAPRAMAKRVKCLNAFNYAHVREKGQGLEELGPQGPYLESEDRFDGNPLLRATP